MAVVDDIADQLASLSEERLNAAASRVEHGQWSRQRQPLDFDTAMEHLRISRDTLQRAVEGGVLASLPITVQNELAAPLRGVVGNLQQIVAGNDALNGFCQHVDGLDTYIWRNRVADRARGVVDLRKKTKELADLGAEVRGLRAELKAILAEGASISDLVKQSRESAAASAQAQQEAHGALQEALRLAQETQTALTQANERSGQITRTLGIVEASEQKTATYAASLKQLYDEGREFRSRMAQAETNAETALKLDEEQVAAVKERLAELEKETRDVLAKTMIGRQFRAFGERSQEIAGGKRRWIVGTVLSLLAAFGIVVLTPELCRGHTSALAIYLRLAAVVPAGGAVWFFVSQYNRERRLEEEYAFRAVISQSLQPYGLLVEQILGTDNGPSRDKYADFVVDSVGSIFTPPTDHRSEVDLSDLKGLTVDQLKQLAEIVNIVWRGPKRAGN